MPSSTAVAGQAPLAVTPLLEPLAGLFRSLDPEARTPSTQSYIDHRSHAAQRELSATVTSTAATPVDEPITWVEPQESLWLLSLKNLGLTLATFGLYHFWGRAEARRQLVGAVHINHRPLDYTGSGKEAFVSFAIGALITLVMVSTFVRLMSQSGGDGIAVFTGFRWERLTISLPLLFLFGSVIYRKRQHILRRTWIDGTRFDLSGYAWGYALHHFWTAFLVPLTLGWAAPWRASRLEHRKIGETYFGAFKFHAVGNASALYWAFAVLWFGGGLVYVTTLIVMSLFIGPELLSAINELSLQPLLSWSVARQGLAVAAAGLLPLLFFIWNYRKVWLEHRVSSIGFNGGQLRLELPFWSFIRLSAGNLLLLVGSVGTLLPVVEARDMRYLLSHLRVDGQLALPPR
jgi:uncharacterized membrane protein YjgN (DUF898 family)